MKYVTILLLVLALFFTGTLYSQIDSVLVETYYVSDATDAIETNDGILPEGSVTYRVYLVLSQGVKVKSIFGNEQHVLKISSTQPFFNNSRGKSFGKDVSKLQLRRNSVALDTWLTIGLASDGHLGIPKYADPDTSILGGAKNTHNMLCSTNPLAGTPLLVKDGLVVKDNMLRNWSATMDGDLYNSSEDTTIFGSHAIVPDFSFISNDFKLAETSGNPFDGSGRILIAQLTTLGELSFEFNVEVVMPNGTVINCVAKNPLPDEVFVSGLTYPNLHIPVCGCPNPQYLEYNSKRECDDMGLCKNLIVMGCTDPQACNFNPEANMNDGLCCYPGKCANRDIGTVCPENYSVAFNFDIYPNPANDIINLKISNNNDNKIRYIIVDSYGKKWKDDTLSAVKGTKEEQISIGDLPKGLYLIKVYKASESGSKKFQKN